MRSKRNGISVADYLYFLSVKYKVECESLLNGLIRARECEEVVCGKLRVQCRQKTRNYDVFLITNGCKVVTQLFIPKSFLDQPNLVKELRFNHLFRKISKDNANETAKHIQDLRCGMKRINLKARVLDIPKAALVFTRFGEYARVTNAVIADETGTIKLCLWNERINTVSVDSVVQIQNARVIKFRGENQLTLGKNGRLDVIRGTDTAASRKIERNLLGASQIRGI